MAFPMYPAPPPYSAIKPPAGPGYPSSVSSQPRYFHIVSQMNGLVMSVEGGTGVAGSRVSTWYRKAADNNDQLWYEDPATGTIRSKISNNCMEISGDGSTLVVNPYAAGNPNQQWTAVEGKIQCRYDRNKVLDIANEQRTPGATICSWSPHGGLNQAWTLEYASPETAPQPFFIKNKMSNLVLGVEGGSGSVGSRVITAFQKQSGYNDDQLWYEDAATGTIRTKINYYCMEMSGMFSYLVVNAYYAGKTNQQWMVVGDKIQCRHDRNKVLDIKGDHCSPGAVIRSWTLHGGPSQLWTLEYQGSGVPSFGIPYSEPAAPLPAKPITLHKSRPFYIRSAMNDRVLDIGGCNSKPGAKVIMYDKVAHVNNQLWYFDESAVIRSWLNDFALEPTGKLTTMQPYVASNPNHQWLYDGKKIYNRTTPNQVLDIRGENEGKWADVIKYPYKASANQHWALDYV